MQNRHFLLAAMLGLSGCGDWTSYAITLTNRSHQPVGDIEADFAGQVRRADRLIRGQYIVLASRGGEGMICLNFRQGGVDKSYGVDYISQNMPAHYQIAIRDHDISVMYNDPITQTLSDPEIYPEGPPGEKCIAN
jgi:hypothetical protein